MWSNSLVYSIVLGSFRCAQRTAVLAWQACAMTAPVGHDNNLRRSPLTTTYWTSWADVKDIGRRSHSACKIIKIIQFSTLMKLFSRKVWGAVVNMLDFRCEGRWLKAWFLSRLCHVLCYFLGQQSLFLINGYWLHTAWGSPPIASIPSRAGSNTRSVASCYRNRAKLCKLLQYTHHKKMLLRNFHCRKGQTLSGLQQMA